MTDSNENNIVHLDAQKEIAIPDRQNSALNTAFDLADRVFMKKYLANMDKYDIDPIKNDNFIASRLFKVTRILYDKEENNQENLLNVYNVLYACGGSVILILNSDGHKVDMYIGTKATSEKKETTEEIVGTCQDALGKVFRGQFCGTESNGLRNPLKEDEFQALKEKILPSSKGKTRNIAAVTSLARFRDGQTMKSGDFVQGVEKLVDAMQGEQYTLMIIADPILPEELDVQRSAYEALYNQLLPFAVIEMTFGKNESNTLSEAETIGLSETFTNNVTIVSSRTHTLAEMKNQSSTCGNTVGGSFIFNLSKSHNIAKIVGNTVSDAATTGVNEGRGEAIGGQLQKNKTRGETTGTSENYTIHIENRHCKTLIDHIETQLTRIDECADVGMWDCAAYVIADSNRDCRKIAAAYRSLIRGKEAGTERAAITVWGSEKYQEVANYLRCMSHPQLKLTEAVPVSPTTVLSGEELTVAAGLPQHSIPGLSVDTCARFGREIIRLRYPSGDKGQSIELGKIYHMEREEESLAFLDIDALAAHTFVTGSTGSGKSNTVYKILEGLQKKKINWLVIEPAKGEYKEVFGGIANVYGTNPYKSPNLLHVNPFEFPADRGIHVLEHVDRLAEIFNACWPMYAAMPAILRESMERAYEACGWNLKTSKNPGKFPTFETLLDILPQVIDSSAYSADTTSDYKGALVTRVRSLTRGIHGLIFSEDTAVEELFDRNAIVDLSRVGSQETKSLIMGILVLKLQEYRMSGNTEPNSALRHITVLEEAHHLLRRTSSEQSQESANLTGQAVAMLANSIAEMRTYGEGFIIADQSPGLMDMSVVRNTNTKIILRLPDEGDRELVGRAAGLNDAQIEELAFLERGVAAIYQSDWAEAVLAKVAKFDKTKPLEVPQEGFAWQDEETEAVKKFLNGALEVEQQDFSLKDIEWIRTWYRELYFTETVRNVVEKVLCGKRLRIADKALLLCYIAGVVKMLPLSKDKLIAQVEHILSGRYDVEKQSKIITVTRFVLNKAFSDIIVPKVPASRNEERVIV